MTKLLNKASIIIPLSAVFGLINSITIVIPELGIYWSYGITTAIIVVVFVLWLCCSPLRKCCCNGRWTETLFNLVPLEMLSMLVFAQWHFVTFTILFVLLIAIEIILMICLRRDERRHRYSEKRHRMYKTIFKRCSVLAVAVICAVPCFMSAFFYDYKSPTYRAEEEIWNRIFTNTEQLDEQAIESDIYQENSDLLDCFCEEQWKHYNIVEKITIMQELVNFESKRLGIPTIPISTTMLGAFTLGQYSEESNEILINIEHLAEATIDECIDTVCHETFHSYQSYLVNGMDWENDILQSEYFSELRSWKENQEDYKSAWISGFEAYENQPLEVAARQYAEEETQRILSYIN